MEYWSVEVKPGETVKIDPEDKYVHLSQVCRRESKKPEDVQLFVKINGQKEEFGYLNQGKYQMKYDVVFEKEFELSNASKNTSVYFRGYKVVMGDDGDDDEFDPFSEEDSEEEELAPKPVPIKLTTVNGKPKLIEEKPKSEKAKAGKKAEVSKAKPMDLDEDDSDDESEDDEDDSDNEEPVKKVKDDEDSEDSDEDEDESGSDEEDDEEEDEATPQKAEVGKKRAKEQKTPTQDKKAKVVSPGGTQKTDGKKGGHVATPHPAKQAPKTPAASNDKSKTPKSAGSVPCKSCTKMFNSENALQSHTKAKHA